IAGTDFDMAHWIRAELDVWVSIQESLEQPIGGRLSLGDADAWLETSYELGSVRIGQSHLTEAFTSRHQGQAQLRVPTGYHPKKLGWRDADDGKRIVVEQDRPAKDNWIAGETLHPEAV